MRTYQLFVALLCIVFGGLVSLTSAAMTFSMLVSPEARAENLFWVGVVGLILAPPIFVVGIRLLLNKPNRYGGVFAPGFLRVMAITNGVIGGLILVLAAKEGDLVGVYGGISFLVTTQGAFVLANNRAKT